MAMVPVQAVAIAFASVLVAEGCARSAETPPAQAAQAQSSPAKSSLPPSLCDKIAADIEFLGLSYPQLAEFSAQTAIEKPDCRISYTYHCQPAARRAGWSSEVPNPDPDGMWLQISVWDENDPGDAAPVIDTEPSSPKWTLGARRARYLILEGGQTKRVENQILAILAKHGMR